MTDYTSTSPGLGRQYSLWLVGIGASLFGSSIFGFALTWVATDEGGTLAGIVNSARLVPGLILVLIGGAWADKHGPWWVMVLSDAAMVGFGVCAGALFHFYGSPAWLLVAAAVCVGTVNSIYIPASAVVPRLLVPERQLGRAMAARTMVGQAASLTAPPLGGFAVAVFGMTALSWFDAGTYLIILVILLAGRRHLTAHQAATAAVQTPHDSQSLLRQAWQGVVLSMGDPVLRVLIVAIGAVAAILLPLSSILVPLLVRSHGWPVQVAGLIGGAEVAGGVVVSLLVIWRGLWSRSGHASSVGLVIVACSCVGLAFAGSPSWATTAGFGIGVGVGIFTSHVGPVVLQTTAISHLARVQSVLLLMQMAPVLITANLIGVASDHFGAVVVTVACGVVVLGTALGICATPAANPSVPDGR